MGNICSKFNYGIGAEAIDFDGKNRYIRITDIDEESSHYIRKSEVSPSFTDENCIVQENDILFARTGASTGKTYLYNKQDGKLYFAGFLIRANVKNEFSSYFIYQQTKTDRYKKWIQIMSARSGQPGINAKEFQEYKVYYPNRQIQDKVASFFILLDKRIDTQSKIIEDLELFKNRISYQIFFKMNAENIVSLGEIASIYQPETISQFDFKNNGAFNVYGANGIIGKYDKYNHEDSEILLSCRGNCGTVNMSMPKSWINGNAMVIHIKIPNINKKFTYYYLQNINFKTLISGSGVPQITRKPVENIKVKIPCKEDQIFITNIMDCIYLKIKKEKDILELYKKQKAYLLKNMFI